MISGFITRFKKIFNKATRTEKDSYRHDRLKIKKLVHNKKKILKYLTDVIPTSKPYPCSQCDSVFDMEKTHGFISQTGFNP